MKAESTERPFGGTLALRRMLTVIKVTPGISRIFHDQAVPTTGILPGFRRLGLS